MADGQAIPSQPFDDDQLDRKKAAEFLTNYLVGRHRVAGSVPGNESFVLNVNAEWGLGKTYFLREWAKMLRSQGHFVVYFDAWENDYSSDPFVGFMSAINAQLTASLPTRGKIANKAKAMTLAGTKVIKTAAPGIALAVIKHLSGVDFHDVASHIEEAAKGAGEEIISIIKADLEKQNKDLKNAIEEFKSSFASFAKTYEIRAAAKLPIFLMVDELDRCRPSYAIELLEKIKHVFRVANVYTVVATDSEQLAHSIKAVYGARFDSRKYLRRFFDHESRLDTPQFGQLAAAMLTQRNMADDPRIINVVQRPDVTPSHADILARIGEMMKLSTRDFMRSIDILDTIRITQSGEIDLVFMSFLIMLYVSHPELFDAYDRTRAVPALRKELGQHVDQDVRWPEIQESGAHGQRPIAASVFDWLLRYMDGVWHEKPRENTDSWIVVRQAIIGLVAGPSKAAKQLSLQQYHKLVSMAGHFSI
ncbi:P-loop NTPase fold protein [Paraburkholderia sp. EG287A]|uniref:KAP family P-loop NTPase fold protein n=1 Tax=unclassified Paraburkholderia TaxID=2615204 RepID=UPI0034D23FB3